MKLTKYITVLLLITITFSKSNFAQNDNTKRQLAQQYYLNKEFDKAVVLYEELYNKSRSKVYFTYYLKSLIEIEEYIKAEKLIKKHIRSYKTEMSYRVELGYLYKMTGDLNKSKDEYDYAINNVTLDHQKIVRLANIFISKREFDFAEKLYIHASKKLHDLYSFKFELANLYYYSRNYEKMIDTYIAVLIGNNGYIQTVQNKLQNAVYTDVNNNLKDLLKTKLIEQIQSNPNKIVLNELLIWLHIQEKEFDRALIQVKALDRRNNEDGERVIALARLANSNKSFDAAISAYNYILDKGNTSYYYYLASNELLELLFNQIVIEKNYETIEINQLEQNYISTISEIGINKSSALLIKNLAHLQAFYLNKVDIAVEKLEKAIHIPLIDQKVQSECKLELGDIYLYQGRVWDATMQYAEVELDNKNNPTGSKAKFKKATLAYYLGDFLWAKAQLDVLKASTSKLIANDSFAFSKLIEANSIFDENDEALVKYAKAELNHYQNQDSLAILLLDSIINEFSGHPLIDESLFLKASIYFNKKEYSKAGEFFHMVYTQHGFDVLGDDALYKLAEMNEILFKNKEKAMELYQEILISYPESIYVVKSRERFRFLRGDEVQ